MSLPAFDDVLDFMVIGAQKAGSTYLLTCLEEHPGLQMPPTEIDFFEDPAYDPQHLERLTQHFKAAGGPQRLRGIKRPNALGIPGVEARIARHAPGAKLIVVLRDPVARAVSAHFHLQRFGLVPLQPIESALTALLDGRPPAGYPAAMSVLTFGLYHQHLERYLHHFSPEQLLVVLYDDIKRDPAGLIAKTYRFLGVDPTYQPQRGGSQPMAGIYSPLALRWLDVLRSVSFERFADGGRVRHRSGSLAGGARLAWRAGTRIAGRVMPGEKPTLSDALRDRLADYYRVDVAALADRFDLDVSMWTTARRPPSGHPSSGALPAAS